MNIITFQALRRLAALAAAVCVTAALVRPGYSMETAVICGKEEHQHEDVCYSPEEFLACPSQPHTHGESCLQDSLCCLADYWIHEHDTACMDPDGQILCTLPVMLPHTHDDGCAAEDGSQTCAEEERVLHTHTEGCFPDGIWSCGMHQLEQHTHDDSCFETGSMLTCQLEEHVHDSTCAPDIPATTETEPQTVMESIPALMAAQPASTAAAAENDRPAVSEPGIRFRLFDYSLDINKASSLTQWRQISDYFTFRSSALTTGSAPSETIHVPEPNINAAHDADGFTAAHATVERTLTDGLPVLDLTRNADGTARTDPGLSAAERSLAYLFRDTGDHAVTAYQPENTILQKDGTRYYYDSSANAVDYDAAENLFRVRSYPERNSTTAGYGSGYGDFLPFNPTGGQVVGEIEGTGTPYHLESTDANYWFGMSMEVSFFQSKNGQVGQENMVFRFSGDDDVWVFVDDVLVLDLGGTHGTVEGSIDFATGQILQYLTWNGANVTEEAKTGGSATSFPTTLRACYDAAGRTPSGGWNEDGTTFADYTQHTLTFFYLERGAAVANCKLDFRLPVLPDKSLTVTKELTAEGATGDFIRDSLSYRFRVMKTDTEGNASEEPYLTPGTIYTLLENSVAVGSGTIDNDGTFSLKAGQSAQFADMLVKGGGAKTYAVQEILPEDLTGQYSGVEYTVSGNGGLTKTEEGPEAGFSAFTSPELSAEQTQMVTFRNRVDTANLSSLEVTKLGAEGSVFPEDAVFPIQVKLGGILLPPGTAYQVGEETRTVQTPGILNLKLGETARLVQGILSGTRFEITEPEIDGLNCRPSYSGFISPEGEILCSADGVTGAFSLGSTARVTVTNASYDHSVQIPISKQALFNDSSQTFSFRLSRMMQNTDGTWIEEEHLPGTTITVSDASVTDGRLLVGFPADAEGVFYYRVEEIPGTGSFLYDDTYYIVQITVSGETAAVTGVLKDGEEALPTDTRLPFVNHRTTSLLVRKTVEGGSREEEFWFTAAVTAGNQTTLTEFSLSHGETFLLPHIPWGAEITLTEEPHDNYIPAYLIEGIHAEAIQGSTVRIAAERENLVVRFVNRCAYELPETGGTGTNVYTLGGMLQMAAAACLLYFQRKREKGDRGSY